MIAKVQKATEAQKKSWFEGTTAERARKIAADTGLTALMRGRGYTQAQLDAALGSEVAQAELTGMTNIGRSADHVQGTPVSLSTAAMPKSPPGPHSTRNPTLRSRTSGERQVGKEWVSTG